MGDLAFWYDLFEQYRSWEDFGTTISCIYSTHQNSIGTRMPGLFVVPRDSKLGPFWGNIFNSHEFFRKVFFPCETKAPAELHHTEVRIGMHQNPHFPMRSIEDSRTSGYQPQISCRNHPYFPVSHLSNRRVSMNLFNGLISFTVLPILLLSYSCGFTFSSQYGLQSFRLINRGLILWLIWAWFHVCIFFYGFYSKNGFWCIPIPDFCVPQSCFVFRQSITLEKNNDCHDLSIIFH